MRCGANVCCLAWLISWMSLPFLASAQSGTNPDASYASLSVKWVSDTSYSEPEKGQVIQSAHIELRARYDIWGGNKLKWVDGGLSAQASWEGESAKFAFVSPEEAMGSAPESWKTGRQKWAGGIVELQDGAEEIDFDVVPGMEGVSGPYDEALGCYGFPGGGKILLTKDNLSKFNKGEEVSIKGNGDPNIAPGCKVSTVITIQRVPIQVKYGESSSDIAQLKYPCGRALDNHVYDMRGGGGHTWLVHADFEGQVLLRGEEMVQIDRTPPSCPSPDRNVVTSDYKILRKARSWSVSSSGDLKVTSPWHSDDLHGEQDWVDNPSYPALTYNLQAIEPDNWPTKGVQDEFLVGVKGDTTCGCVYISYRLELKPEAYRIKYSAPEEVDQDAWEKHLQSGAPVDLRFQGDEGWVHLEYNKDTKQWQIAGAQTK